MAQNLFRNKQTDLDLNGPNLSFTINPSNQNGNTGDNVSFVGIATATFPNAADNSGSIAYQWYEVGVGKITDGGKLAGTATTTLTLSNLVTPGDNGRQFYLEADYTPSYYQTGNAINEPLNSGIGSVTVADQIAITTQPIPITGITTTNNTFNVVSNVNGDTQNLSYQWQVDGTDVSDGTITKQSVETIGSNVRVTEQTFTTGSFTIPANATDIRLDLAGGCGGRGADTHLHSGGNGGDGMAAWFSIPSSSSARTVYIEVGKNGNDGLVGTASSGGLGGHGGVFANGGTGAKSGSTGLNGSGGGGGGATWVTIGGNNAIVVGGGAGGGGASESGAGTDGADAGPTSGSIPFYGLSDTDTFAPTGGNSAVTSTGAGGGGAGGGSYFTYNSTSYTAATAGTSGSSATGGSQGHSAYRTSLATLDGGSYNRYEKSRGAGSGWAFLSYTTTSTTNTNDIKTTTVSGAETASLTLNTDKVGVAYTVGVQVTGTASNSPLTSDIVGYNVVSQFDQAVVNIEAIGITTSASLSTINLNNGEITFTSSDSRSDNTNSIREYVLYSPERNIEVEMDMYGAKGYDNFVNGTSNGGEGGYGKIRFTLEKNVEYVLTGLSTSIGAPALYRKASLLAVVGQGGKGGEQGGQGGRGGGHGIAGQGGNGNTGGTGGDTIPVPSSLGVFGSIINASLQPGDSQATAPNGGRILSCPRGIYWAQQGVSQCSDVGTVQYRLSDGSIVANTSSSITRGYKTGYNIIETAGAAVGNGGVGGNGANGGNGGSGQGGGGGGSGYASGVTVVSSSLGGGVFNEPRVILRVV